MIYLDANAGSRIRPEVVERLQSLWSECGNPSSVHARGRRARALLKEARRSVLSLVSLNEPTVDRLVFTSGGTEACNQMILGMLGPLFKLSAHPGHLITSTIEHPAVLETIGSLERSGWSVTRVAPTAEGLLTPEAVVGALSDTTALVCIMAANNESGALQPIAAIARAVREAGFSGPIVSDLVQAVGKSRISVPELFAAGVSAVAISGHKIGALPGIGAVIYADGSGNGHSNICFPVEPLIVGGPQEERLRAGTENLPGAVSFGTAAKVAAAGLDAELERRAGLREQLWSLLASIAGAERLGPKDPASLISNTLLVRFPECRGDDLVVALDLKGVAASTGAACASGKQTVSEAVKALQLAPGAGREVIRFSLDWDADEAQLAEAAGRIAECVAEIRRFAPNTDTSQDTGSAPAKGTPSEPYEEAR